MKKFAPLFTAAFTVFFLMINVISPYIVKAAEPEVEAKAAIIMELETGRVLYEKNSREKLAMASTTKIMTAMLALELGNLSDIVQISARCAAAPKVKMGLTKGEKIPLRDLLYALMLQSSNDAAIAIAEHIGGSVENFCALMTHKARAVGALDTSFETPNGLDSENHYSTAFDLAQIARYALSDKAFISIINTQSWQGKSDRQSYSISNKNRLLNEYSGAFGVKTGFTGNAGHCFVGAAERGGTKLVTVVLASGWGEHGKAQKWVDTKKLLNYGFENFAFIELVKGGEVFGETPVSRSKTQSISAVSEEGLILPISVEEKERIRIVPVLNENLHAPVEKNEKIGALRVYIGEKLEREINLLAKNAVERHDLKTSLEKVLGYFLELTTREEIKVNLPIQ